MTTPFERLRELDPLLQALIGKENYDRANKMLPDPRDLWKDPHKAVEFGTQFISPGIFVRAEPEAASLAEALLKRGHSPADVHAATGTFRGLDGVMRREIDDSGARLLPEGRVSHPELERVLPDLRTEQSITIGAPERGSHFQGRIEASGPTEDSALSTALHELQHAVQEHQGLAPGGTVAELGRGGYDFLPGEAEARLVSARRALSPVERRASYPLDPAGFQQATGVHPDLTFDPRLRLISALAAKQP